MTPQRHRQIKDAFLAACDLPRGEREGVLVEHCGDDDDLRGEVEILLAQHDATAHADQLPDDDVSEEKTVEIKYQPVVGTPAADGPPLSEFAERELTAGTIIGQRYRIVAPLGRGGMGEVFRADDLQLSQEIAVKFLFRNLAKDPRLLARLHHEVRVARAVTHPNVCRVYDIDHSDGDQFITMEYIDGEHLAALLKRIGRVPPDKALQIARQLCAGLAAAHAKGVLHRDLKPTNVMLDGTGQVRIMDFGLAGLAEDFHGREIRAGTPAYMAPEQISGKEVTLKSDVYSLGLVLYELFTGMPAFRAKSAAEYLQLHRSSHPSLPSSIIHDIDPAVEQVILSCIDKDPAKRPASAMAVAAALPGGNLLAAALAAGETPSPEMVAAAAPDRPIKLSVAASYLAAFMVMLVLFIILNGVSEVDDSVIPPTKPPEALAEKAREIVSELGYTKSPADEAYGFSEARACRASLARVGGTDAIEVGAEREGTIQFLFWYRRSPEPLIPVEANNLAFGEARVTITDPPPFQPDMMTLIMDCQGRLLHFRCIPAEVRDGEVLPIPVAWSALLARAGLDDDVPQVGDARIQADPAADETIAWEAVRDDTQAPLLIEAASFQGRPVLFTVHDRSPPEDKRFYRSLATRKKTVDASFSIVALVVIVIALPLAWKNFGAGHCDRRGAIRLSVFVFCARMLVWFLFARHVASVSDESKLAKLAGLSALGEAFSVWLLYIALEPYVRRFWPQTIITWSRLLMLRLRDPLVGRDVLIGAVFGAYWALLNVADRLIVVGLGWTPRTPIVDDAVAATFVTARYGLAASVGGLLDSLYRGLVFVLLLALLRWICKRALFGAVLAALIIATMYMPRGSHQYTAWLMVGIAAVGAGTWLMVRYGLVALVAGSLVSIMLSLFPITLSSRLWYADKSLFALSVVMLVAAYGFATAIKKSTLAPASTSSTF